VTRSYGRRVADDLTGRYGDLLTGSYDCVDRVVLNAYYPLRYDPGGFRVWWRRWHDDSDNGLDDAHLMRLAGRFGSDSRVAGPHAQASPTRPRIPDTPNWTFCARLRHCGCCLHSAPSRRYEFLPEQRKRLRGDRR
jgi:hypothetical protein